MLPCGRTSIRPAAARLTPLQAEPPVLVCSQHTAPSIQHSRRLCSSVRASGNAAGSTHLAGHKYASRRDAARCGATTSSAPVVSFMDSAEDGFLLQLEPGQLLGFKPGQTLRDSEVNQNYDQLLAEPLEPGYSQQATANRAEVLEMVRTMIITSKGRPRTQAQQEVIIPPDLLPGALALLAQLQYNDIVLHIGSDVLRGGELEAFPVIKNDVLLSMALAKCNLAAEEFGQGKQVAAGCRLLEEALQLLQPKPGAPAIAPQLAMDVRGSLADLHTQCALEQVTGPILKETAEERKRAVRTIRDMLRGEGGTGMELPGFKGRGSGAPAHQPALPIDRDFVARVMQQLTLDEVVFLLEWELVARHTNAYKWYYPGLLERVAAGHILLGYLQCQPQYIKMAMQVLKHMASTSETLVMQGMCQLLLGSVHTAAESMRQAEAVGNRAPRYADAGEAPHKPIWGVGANKFVRDNTPPGEDGLLPGLVRYTEMWLRDYAAPMFRDTAARPPNTALTKYFDNTHVEALISVYDEKTDTGPLQGLVSGLSDGLDRVKDNVRLSLGGAPDLGRRSMSPLPEERGSGQAGLLLPLAVVGAVAMGTFFMTRQARPLAAATPTAAVAAPATAAKAHKPVVDSAPQLQPKVAEQVLRVWQEIKAAALGPDYDASELGMVLCEPVLSETRAKVAKFRADGWYMKYKLRRIKVREVVAVGDRAATVAATLDELATVYYADGQQADSAKSMYNAQYELVKGKDGAWRVSRFTVQDT